MSTVLARKDPQHFKTQALHVEADAHALHYQGLPLPLNFQQMLARRRPLAAPKDSRQFVLELANLGVSVRLTLAWQGQDYQVLVRQRRSDRGDCVLKLISGYVPAHELQLPLLSAVTEVAEECLVESPAGWLQGRYLDTWLATPYPTLRYCHQYFQLRPQCGAALPVYCQGQPLMERPQAYVHLPSASLQLVYDLRLQLPDNLRQISLQHADERLEGDALVARLEPQHELFLLAPEQNRLFTLEQGELRPFQHTQALWLSEAFATRDGWLVHDERIAWHDWLRRAA